WGLPVGLPERVLADLRSRANEYTVVVRNGVVISAGGELDQGRSSRQPNRAQRRALRALYSTCAIPGCCVRFAKTKLHHVVWWRLGGRTDLENLLPLCELHHQAVHHDAWLLTLAPNRILTITLPDGQVMTTGPPKREAA
ncbi:MAG TPA: HNH endonuclease signature motif containing protein, partial [Ilumatobacteraceae bacterium]